MTITPEIQGWISALLLLIFSPKAALWALELYSKVKKTEVAEDLQKRLETLKIDMRKEYMGHCAGVHEQLDLRLKAGDAWFDDLRTGWLKNQGASLLMAGCLEALCKMLDEQRAKDGLPGLSYTARIVELRRRLDEKVFNGMVRSKDGV